MKPPAMHETLTRVISQAHVQPILRPAGRSVVYIHPVYQPFLTDERPTRVRPEIVVAPRAEVKAMRPEPTPIKTAWPCLDCREPFDQKAWNHVRCVACGVAHRRGTDLARKTTDKSRRPAPRNSGRRSRAA